MPEGKDQRKFLRGASAALAAAPAVLAQRGGNDHLGITCIGVGTRSRVLPRCHVERTFQEAAPIPMSVESFRGERKVLWDAALEEFV